MDAYSFIVPFAVIVPYDVDQWRENRPHCLEVIDIPAVLDYMAYRKHDDTGNNVYTNTVSLKSENSNFRNKVLDMELLRLQRLFNYRVLYRHF